MSESEDSPAEHEGLSDIKSRIAITDVLSAYCRAMDRLDYALALRCWHDDGTVDYGKRFVGPVHEFVDFALAFHTTLIRHSHQITNVTIKIDGSRAASEAYGSATTWLEVDDSVVERVSRVRYLDRWSHRDGRWAIDHRITMKDTCSDHVLSSNDSLSLSPWHRGSTDPSYELFASFSKETASTSGPHDERP